MDVLLSMLPLGSPWVDAGKSTVPLVRALCEDKRHLLMLGTSELGRQALLFQAAVTLASEGKSVVYICRQPLSNLPPPVHGMPPPTASTLHNVKFLYLENARELEEFCATVHTRAHLPTALVVDNLDLYADVTPGERVEPSLARLCALLIDALSHAQNHAPSVPCRLLLAADSALLPHTACLSHLGMATASITADSGHHSGHHSDSGSGRSRCCVSCHLSNRSTLSFHYAIEPSCLRLLSAKTSLPP